MAQNMIVPPVSEGMAAAREKRAYVRTPVNLHGKLFVRGRQPSHCSIIDLSPGGACVETGSIPETGEEVILDIACTGRIRGVVVRSDPFDFGVQFTLCDAGKSRLASQIAIQFNKQRLHLEDKRVAEREAGDGCDQVEFADGSIEDARIKDVSLTGVAFVSDRRPAVGERVQVGVLSGTVARLLDDGFAVAFDPPSTPV